MRAHYPRITSGIQEAASWGLSKVLWCTRLVLMHAFPIQAEALFAKTIYPGCHCSCRLVKSTARIFIRSYRLLTYHALVRKSGFPTPPISTVILRINHIFVEPTALRRTRGHVTVRPGSHCKDFGVRNNIESECLWDLLD
jgi:hypothetical protein